MGATKRARWMGAGPGVVSVMSLRAYCIRQAADVSLGSHLCDKILTPVVYRQGGTKNLICSSVAFSNNLHWHNPNSKSNRFM